MKLLVVDHVRPYHTMGLHTRVRGVAWSTMHAMIVRTCSSSLHFRFIKLFVVVHGRPCSPMGYSVCSCVLIIFITLSMVDRGFAWWIMLLHVRKGFLFIS